MLVTNKLDLYKAYKPFVTSLLHKVPCVSFKVLLAIEILVVMLELESAATVSLSASISTFMM